MKNSNPNEALAKTILDNIARGGTYGRKKIRENDGHSSIKDLKSFFDKKYYSSLNYRLLDITQIIEAAEKFNNEEELKGKIFLWIAMYYLRYRRYDDNNKDLIENCLKAFLKLEDTQLKEKILLEIMEGTKCLDLLSGFLEEAKNCRNQDIKTARLLAIASNISITPGLIKGVFKEAKTLQNQQFKQKILSEIVLNTAVNIDFSKQKQSQYEDLLLDICKVAIKSPNQNFKRKICQEIAEIIVKNTRDISAKFNKLRANENQLIFPYIIELLMFDNYSNSASDTEFKDRFKSQLKLLDNNKQESLDNHLDKAYKAMYYVSDGGDVLTDTHKDILRNQQHWWEWLLEQICHYVWKALTLTHGMTQKQARDDFRALITQVNDQVVSEPGTFSVISWRLV